MRRSAFEINKPEAAHSFAVAKSRSVEVAYCFKSRRPMIACVKNKTMLGPARATQFFSTRQYVSVSIPSLGTTVMPTPSLSAPVQPTTQFPLCAAQCALLAEVNHRTANQFTLLTSYIHLSLEEFRRHPGEIRNLQLAFAAVEARARSLASLNRQLIQVPTSRHPVDVSLILHEVCAAFGSSGSAKHRIAEEITGPYLVTHSVNVAVGQIVTEAVMNALKYAYPEDQAGEITVRSTPTESGELLIEVADRGVGGLPASFSTGAKSFGVRLMRGLARQENIGLSFVGTSPGLSVQFVLPSARRSDSNIAAADELGAR